MPVDIRQLGSKTFHTIVHVYDAAYNPSAGNVWRKRDVNTLYATRELKQNMLLQSNGSGGTVLQQLWAILLKLGSMREQVPKHPKGQIPPTLLNDDGRKLSDADVPCIYRRISPALNVYWGETGDGQAREERHSETPTGSSVYDEERRRYPDAKLWDTRAALELDINVPSTFMHVFESLFCVLSNSTGNATSLNSRLFDKQFYKTDMRVAPVGVRLYLEAVTAHVDAGGFLPTNNDKDGSEKLFGHVVPGISAAWMTLVARDQFRQAIATPYLAAHPIPINSWAGHAPGQGGVKGKKRVLKDRLTTSGDSKKIKKSLEKSGLGSRKLK